MYLTKYRVIPAGLILLLILLHTRVEVLAQNPDVSQQKIYAHLEWVSSWPSADKKQNSKSLDDRLNSLLFGIKLPVLSNPVSVLATDPTDFWIPDQGNRTVFHVHGGVGDIPHSILKTDFDLSSLVGICQASNSSILITDSRAEKIYKLSKGEKKLQILNLNLKLEQPTGIAYLPDKHEIWVVETKGHCISVLNDRGDLIRKIGKRGIAPGEFNYPTHIWIDKKGKVYITDSMNFRVQVLDSKGEIISVFGEAGDATGYFARPKGIATDSFGNIYVVDGLFNSVQVFDIKGQFLYAFGNQGHGNGEFWMPNGIFIDEKDNIYVADTYNSRIQIFKLTHTISK